MFFFLLTIWEPGCSKTISLSKLLTFILCCLCMWCNYMYVIVCFLWVSLQKINLKKRKNNVSSVFFWCKKVKRRKNRKIITDKIIKMYLLCVVFSLKIMVSLHMSVCQCDWIHEWEWNRKGVSSQWGICSLITVQFNQNWYLTDMMNRHKNTRTTLQAKWCHSIYL